jgi:outer membrane protein assembly factor BamB
MIPRFAFTCLLVAGSFTQSARGADWPQWRGPERTGLSEETGLLQEWPAGGPPLAWKINHVGIGFSTPAVVGNRLYVMGNRDNNELVFAIDVAKKGKPLWEVAVGPVRNEGAGYPGPRSTPTIDKGRLYTLGINGDLVALDAKSGSLFWRRDLVADFGGSVPNWGYSESVLIDGDNLLCTPGGGQATIVKLAKRDGAVVWKSTFGDGAGYSSIIKAQLAGREQYVQFTALGVVGVDAKTGKLLWRYDAPANGTADISTPIAHDDFVFAASGYGTGGGLVSIAKNGEQFRADQVYFAREMKNQHGGVLLVNGSLYGANDPGMLTCLEFKTGKLKWSDRAPGKCSLCYADGRLYARSENGPVSLVAATPDGFTLHGQFDQPERSDQPSWPHPVIANGILYLRDQGLLLAYDIRARKP